MVATTLEARLARLQIVTAVLFLAVVALAARPWILPDIDGHLRVNRLDLLTEDGHVAARLGTSDGTASLALLDAGGQERATLFHDDEGTGLYILDASGTTRIGIAQFAHGGGGVALHGPASRGALVLYYKNAGSLRFFAADGEVLREIAAADLRNP